MCHARTAATKQQVEKIYKKRTYEVHAGRFLSSYGRQLKISKADHKTPLTTALGSVLRWSHFFCIKIDDACFLRNNKLQRRRLARRAKFCHRWIRLAVETTGDTTERKPFSNNVPVKELR
jgi:hypothetical protein